jgi:hypothetical protein
MERRHQVFVSSTFQDLTEERQEVLQALLELDIIPSGMELFPAADDDQWTLIKRVIDDCDYYVVIVAGRYGSTDAAGISYTEKEYDYAVSRQIPVLAFIHADPGAIASKKVEKSTDAQEKLEAFKKKVLTRMCQTWTDAKDLGGKVSRSLVKTMKTHPRPGWVRASEQADAESIVKFKRRIEELQAALDQARTTPPAGSEELAGGAAVFSIAYGIKSGRSILDPVLRRASLQKSWDDIFRTLGPMMFEEASEGRLNARIAALIEEETGEDRRVIAVEQGTLDAIKIQLLALGLVKKSERRRAADDHDTYWTITPYGQTVLTRLIAIPKQGMQILVSDARFVDDWKAVVLGFEVKNLGEADTVTSIVLRVGDDVYGADSPPSTPSVSMVIAPPLRLERNDGRIGTLYFPSPVPRVPSAELLVRRVAGPPLRCQVTIRLAEEGSPPSDPSAVTQAKVS